MKSMPTLAVSTMLPSVRNMPLPSYAGNASVRSSRTRTNPGSPPLVGARGLTVAVHGGQEHHVPRLDELRRARIDDVVDEELIDAVGNPPTVEGVLKPALRSCVVHALTVRLVGRLGTGAGPRRTGPSAAIAVILAGGARWSGGHAYRPGR